ncbi:alpha/beta fold hydrolase [Actinomadura luteofluorescens]|uniref:alpha/beta fold hydrolase n=1 Tax=Actinomadura luteofluorescens TaxID=46163 RepID=UPI00363DADB6
MTALAWRSRWKGPPPLLFLHEVAGDLHDWRAQVAHFADRYTCVRYNARGYPPSDVPAAPDSYGQHIAVQDAIAVLDGLGFDAAHVVGLSMGGFCAVHLMLQRPERCLSATVAGAGYGSAPHQRTGFTEEARTAARMFREDVRAAADAYQNGPTRVQYRLKDPDGWRSFGERLAGRDPVGMSLTFSQVLAERPSLYDLRDRLAAVRTPSCWSSATRTTVASTSRSCSSGPSPGPPSRCCRVPATPSTWKSPRRSTRCSTTSWTRSPTAGGRPGTPPPWAEALSA